MPHEEDVQLSSTHSSEDFLATSRSGKENFNLIKRQEASDQMVDKVCLESWGSMSQKLSYTK